MHEILIQIKELAGAVSALALIGGAMIWIYKKLVIEPDSRLAERLQVENNKLLTDTVNPLTDAIKDLNYNLNTATKERAEMRKDIEVHEGRLDAHDIRLTVLETKEKYRRNKMQEITNIITGSSLSILTILAGIVVKLVKDYLLKKGGEKAVKIAEIVARNAVEAVEQISYDKDIKGIEKLTEAKVAVRDELSKHNVYLSDKQMEVFIESAVKRMNDNWKGQ